MMVKQLLMKMKLENNGPLSTEIYTTGKKAMNENAVKIEMDLEYLDRNVSDISEIEDGPTVVSETQEFIDKMKTYKAPGWDKGYEWKSKT